MTERRLCPPAPGPLEAYAARFDDLMVSLAQRRSFREYLTGLLAEIKGVAGADGVDPDVEPQEVECRPGPRHRPTWSLVKRGIGNLAAADLGQVTRAVKRKLKMFQYRPEVIDGCLADTGLTLSV
ncbi:hypothetical protein ABIA33_006423 [Streptacidiphilus sp. MAP12-16]|uniref:hypothetical protein n=1 Tax=Streptacidiphilus sp. MAP12-16 TaxID=3156300 RepID=UPI003514F763